MTRYFKVVALPPEADWYEDELRNGRARFGWSGPGLDLRRIEQIDSSQRTPAETTAWRFGQFMRLRLNSGDRLVIQTRQPLRTAWLAEVVAPVYAFDDDQARDDFNNIIHVRLLVPTPISINAHYVPLSLKHDLTKRGHYYEIYSTSSRRLLDAIVAGGAWARTDGRERQLRDDIDDLRKASIELIEAEISQRWPSKNFESFCVWLCRQIPGLDVSDVGDRKKGWDFRIRIRDPLMGEILHDDVPVQCKNFQGFVDIDEPLRDLRRSIEHSGSQLAYLFMLGRPTGGFRKRVEELASELSTEKDRPVTLQLVDYDRIAALYMRYGVVAGGEDDVEPAAFSPPTVVGV